GDHVVAVNNFTEDVEAMRTQLQLKRVSMSVKVAEVEVEPDMSSLENATRLVLPNQDLMPRCPSCGNMYMGDSLFCRRCGRPRADSGMR
ncbi:Rnf38, partial [Symbiodinium pilosum]